MGERVTRVKMPEWLLDRGQADLETENERLRQEIARLKSEMSQREAAAYEHGLGRRASLQQENVMLATAIAAFVDPSHPLNLRRPIA